MHRSSLAREFLTTKFYVCRGELPMPNLRSLVRNMLVKEGEEKTPTKYNTRFVIV